MRKRLHRKYVKINCETFQRKMNEIRFQLLSELTSNNIDVINKYSKGSMLVLERGVGIFIYDDTIYINDNKCEFNKVVNRILNHKIVPGLMMLKMVYDAIKNDGKYKTYVVSLKCGYGDDHFLCKMFVKRKTSVKKAIIFVEYCTKLKDLIVVKIRGPINDNTINTININDNNCVDNIFRILHELLKL